MQATSTRDGEVFLSLHDRPKPVPSEIAFQVETSIVFSSLLTAAFSLSAISLTLVLVAAFTGHNSNTLRRLFDLDQEANIPTAFSAFLLLTSAALLSVIALHKRHNADSFRYQWLVLACGFCAMAVDELSSIHEMLIWPVRHVLARDHVGPFYFAWVVPAIIGIGLLSVYLFSFLRHLPPLTRVRFLIAGTVYLTGAVGLEMVGGIRAEQFGPGDFLYILGTQLEETLEMLGLVLFIRALLLYLHDFLPQVRLRCTA